MRLQGGEDVAQLTDAERHHRARLESEPKELFGRLPVLIRHLLAVAVKPPAGGRVANRHPADFADLGGRLQVREVPLAERPKGGIAAPDLFFNPPGNATAAV